MQIVDDPKIMNFQRAANVQGARFAEVCKDALTFAGFEITNECCHFDDIGIEIDIMANNRHDMSFLFECKGSMRGDRPGLIRTDTTKKAIANAVLLSWSEYRFHFPPLIVLASHMPNSGAALAMINMVPTSVILDILNPYNHGKQLQWWAQVDKPEIETYIENNQYLTKRIASVWFCH